MLGVKHIDAIDQSDFEGANIILDLSRPVPPALHGQFDFIFNGSVLDNIWDPPELMRNMSRLAGNGARVIHVETATLSQFSYSALSPSWYFDYYVGNTWGDCKVYVAAVPNWDGLLGGPWAVMAFDPQAEAQPNAFTPGLGDHIGVSIVLAEKTPQATVDSRITQSHYRSEAEWHRFLEQVEAVRRSSRPLFLGEGGQGTPITAHRNVWLSCGWWGGSG